MATSLPVGVTERSSKPKPGQYNTRSRLFVAKSFEASAELSTEHRDLQWRDYEQAINTVTQDGPREILEQADQFLDEREAEDDEEE